MIAKITIKPELICVANRSKIDPFMGTIDLIIRGLGVVLAIRGRLIIFVVLGDVNLILITDV